MTILLVKKLHQSGFGQCFKTGPEDKSDIYSDHGGSTVSNVVQLSNLIFFRYII